MTIITMPARSSLPRAAQDAILPGHALFLPSPAGRALLADLDVVTREERADCGQAVARLLAESLATPDLLAGLVWQEDEGDRPARLDLAQTHTFRVFARRWQPGQVGPLRRFMDWFAFGIVSGQLVELDDAPGLGPSLAAGAVRHGPGDGQQLRRLANLSAEIALSLHVEGLPQAAAPPAPAVMAVAADVQPGRRTPLRLVLIPGGRSD